MREFTRLMLSAYPKLPKLIESIDRMINETALRSFYEQRGALGIADRLVRKLQMRIAVAAVLSEMQGAMQMLTEEERKIVCGRYFGTCPTHAKGEYAFSKTTYYRKLKKAIRKIEGFLSAHQTEEKFCDANLYNITFFRYLSEHIKESRRKEEIANEKSPQA